MSDNENKFWKDVISASISSSIGGIMGAITSNLFTGSKSTSPDVIGAPLSNESLFPVGTIIGVTVGLTIFIVIRMKNE
ncbi:hypothetical protein [Cyanobacterium sp. Dongsha4]|uniref:hypothetical protein n=1 Tax=Cyanobacterium sp. DS4 TaxID=2878255 RepID=UPI002E821C80|nr:hypothetical protein [Cyanobacterium sp. Dongsha4]WVL02534.1 hypothetical protein Dongsha4_18755 [Cyanobacterium sp. Dongsha4]